MRTETFERGMQIRRDLMGAEAAEKLVAGASDFDRPLEELVTEYCFGAVWGREELSRKTRSMLTIGMLMAANRLGPLKIHVKNGLVNGVTKDEIREIILHGAIYLGVAAANEAMRVTKEAFAEAGVK
jgi:4-carboxymuconolactone decarboxylase